MAGKSIEVSGMGRLKMFSSKAQKTVGGGGGGAEFRPPSPYRVKGKSYQDPEIKFRVGTVFLETPFQRK